MFVGDISIANIKETENIYVQLVGSFLGLGKAWTFDDFLLENAKNVWI